MVYRTLVRRVRGRTVTSRAEEWRYLATELDANGVVHLDGRPEGIGLLAEVDGRTADVPFLERATERARAELPSRVGLDLRMTGTVVGCTVTDPVASLAHRVLGVRLPPSPVAAGASWRDDALVIPFARMLPKSTEVSAAGVTTLLSVEVRKEAWRAELEHNGTIRTTPGGPKLHVTGRSSWDTDPGALATRELEVRMLPDVGDDQVGVLSVRVERLGLEMPSRR